MAKDNIIISSDKLYLAVKEAKEVFELLGSVPIVPKNVILRHDIKMRYQQLDNILTNGGIDHILAQFQSLKRQLMLNQELLNKAEGDEDGNTQKD